MATKETRSLPHASQQGAALVEMALTIIAYLIVVMGIIEFAWAIFQVSQLVESTRAGVRTAIVSTPACNVFSGDTGLPNLPNCTLNCATAPEQSIICNQSGTENGGCPIIVTEMQKFSWLVKEENVKVTYRCSGTGDEYRLRNDDGVDYARINPEVTVELVNLNYSFLLPGLLGLSPTITMPSFPSTRIAEDMHTSPSP